jgi:hypothetical protein
MIARHSACYSLTRLTKESDTTISDSLTKSLLIKSVRFAQSARHCLATLAASISVCRIRNLEYKELTKEKAA